jgi:hypothetical protein
MILRLTFALLFLGSLVFARAGEVLPAFAVGQQWSYPTRPAEPASRLVILRIDDHPKLGRIVHVGVLGARLRLTADQPAVPWTIGHMPFREAVLRKNVTRLELAHSDEVFPEFEQSYAGWKVEADAGKQPVWTGSVAKSIEGLETMILRNRKQHPDAR